MWEMPVLSTEGKAVSPQVWERPPPQFSARQLHLQHAIAILTMGHVCPVFQKSVKGNMSTKS